MVPPLNNLQAIGNGHEFGQTSEMVKDREAWHTTKSVGLQSPTRQGN